MATGIYGTVRASDMKPEEVDINVFYQPSRESQITKNFKVNSSNLNMINNPNNPSASFEIFGGLYTLTLPVTDFGDKGIYTIVFKPVEIRTTITECGVLSSFPDIKGIIFDTTRPEVSQFLNKFQNNQLIGYRVEYLTTNSDDIKIRNTFRIITSNNKAEPVNQNLSDTSQKAIRYRLDDNSNLVFCTVSPSSPTNVKPNILPFIGLPNQDVIITNTYFTPFSIEIEMVEYDIDSLAIGMFGNQTKSLEDGIYTIYNFNNDIYKQYNLFEIKDRFNGKPLFEIKENRFNNIDFSKGFEDVSNV